MARKATSLSRLHHSLLIPIDRTDRFYSVMDPTGAGKSSVGSHHWIFLLPCHWVIHVYSSSTPTWARKRQEWVTISDRALRNSSLSLSISHQTRKPSLRLVLVDTPGFNDTNEVDLEILRRIAVWLASSWGQHIVATCRIMSNLTKLWTREDMWWSHLSPWY